MVLLPVIQVQQRLHLRWMSSVHCLRCKQICTSVVRLESRDMGLKEVPATTYFADNLVLPVLATIPVDNMAESVQKEEHFRDDQYSIPSTHFVSLSVL